MSFSVKILRAIGILISMLAIASFFFPYLTSNDESRGALDLIANERIHESTDLTHSDVKDISLFEYAKLYYQGGDDLMHQKYSGILYTITYGAVAGFAVLALLSSMGTKPVLMFIFSLLLGGNIYLINWDFIDRRIMPSDTYLWGISYYLYYPCVAILLLCAVCLFVAKHNAKKLQRSASAPVR